MALFLIGVVAATVGGTILFWVLVRWAVGGSRRYLEWIRATRIMRMPDGTLERVAASDWRNP